MLVYRRSVQGAVACILAIVFGVLGALLLNAESDMFEKRIEYSTGDTSVAFSIEERVEGPIFLSYELLGFYANQKRFVESKDDFLVGSLINRQTCEGAQDLDDVRWRRCDRRNCSLDSIYSRVERAGAFRPCGLVALSMFTDRYQLVNLDDGSNVSLDQRDISLPLDDEIFKDKILAAEHQTNDFTVEGVPSWLERGDFFEHFKVWYRTPASPVVRNLWAKIDGPLKRGRYVLHFVENSPVWTDEWLDMTDPKKAVLLSQAHVLGSRGACKFLGVISTVFCCAQVAMAFFFCFALPLLKD